MSEKSHSWLNVQCQLLKRTKSKYSRHVGQHFQDSKINRITLNQPSWRSWYEIGKMAKETY